MGRSPMEDDEASDSAPSSKGPKPQELLERALKAKGQVKQRLADLSREHRLIDARVKSSGASKRPRDDYRGRDDRPPPERAHRERRSTDEAGAGAGVEAATAPSAEVAPEVEGAGEATNDTATKMEADGAEGNEAVSTMGDGKGAERRAKRARERGVDSPGGRATPRDPRTKEDAETRQRNRKMFGGLMGHLRRASEDHEVASSGAGHTAVQQQKLAKVRVRNCILHGIVCEMVRWCSIRRWSRRR